MLVVVKPWKYRLGMIENYNVDENEESKLKPEERLPDAFGGENNWIQDIEKEKVLERVERFKEKTGLNDEQVKNILDGGEAKGASELEKDHPLFLDENGEIDYDKDEHVEKYRNIAMLVLSNDKTIELIEKLEEESGFTVDQTAKILKGSAEYSNTVLEMMTASYMPRNFELIREKGELDNDDITAELEGIAEGSGLDTFSMVESRIEDLYSKHVHLSPEEMEMEEERAYIRIDEEEANKIAELAKKDPMDFRSRVNSGNSSGRTH